MSGSGPLEFLTFLLLAIILMTGPLVLGAARLWIELPLLVGVALLLMLQGFRLAVSPLPGERRQLDAIDLSVILFTLYAIGRWLTSPTEYFSRLEILSVIAYAGIFLTCRYGLRRRGYGVALLLMLSVLGAFETGFGYYLYQHSDWFPFGPTERLQIHYLPRWIGTYGCPNHYGSLLVIAIGAALALGSFSKLSWPMRIVLFYLAGMMMFGVMGSGSRGTWLAFIALVFALLIFGLRHGTVRWWVPVTAAIALVASVIGLFSLSSQVRGRFNETMDIIQSGALDTYVRIELDRDALRIARDYPIFGTGPGTFVFVHPRYQDSTFGYKAVLTHDDYLNCLADYGLIGFILAMFFVIAVTFKYFSPLRSDQRWQDRALVATGFAAWAALLVHSTVDFNLHIPANAMLFFALTGMALGRLKGPEEPSRSTIPFALLGRWLGWGIVVLSLAYGAEAARTGVSDIIYEQAFNQAEDVPSSESIRNAEAALQYDPINAQDLLFLGDLHRYIASRQTKLEDRVTEGQKALDYYQRALATNKLNDSIEARMGMTFDVMRRYSEAFFCYKSAVMNQPYDGQFWFWLGNHYWQRGLPIKAEQAYLLSEKCPHGFEASFEAEKELRQLRAMQDVPAPAPGTNPLLPTPTPPQPVEPPTTP